MLGKNSWRIYWLLILENVFSFKKFEVKLLINREFFYNDDKKIVYAILNS